MHKAFDRDVYCLLGLPFDAVDTATALKKIRGAIGDGRRCYFSTPNLNFLIGCLSDHEFSKNVVHSDLCVADGMPIVWIAKVLGIPLSERVAGSTLFERLRGGGKISVLFFGGIEGVAEMASRRINEDQKGMICAGAIYPGIGSVDSMSSNEMIDQINASGADFVVVSLGAKKGQAWIELNRDRLSAPVVSHLGAVVNFVAGTVNRAPLWMQQLGLEWLWRVKEEPALWKRYARDGIHFVRLIVMRVIPLIWFRIHHRPSQVEINSAAIDTYEAGDDLVIVLSGAWTSVNLLPLRACFSRATESEKNVRISMAKVSYVDSAFLGQVQLLHNAQIIAQRRLSFNGLQKQVEQFFRYSCVGYLLR